MSGVVSSLGALSPGVQTQLEAALALAEETETQARTDLLMLLETGGSDEEVAGYSGQLDQLAKQRLQLHAELMDLEDAEAASWSARAGALQQQLEDVWKSLGGARYGSTTSLAFRGLWWGLGVAGASVALFWLVYRGKKKARRTGRR